MNTSYVKNYELKAVSIVAACLLAFLVRTVLVPVESGSSVLQLVLPVEVKNLPTDTMILEPQVRQVEVTLQGQSTLLAKIAAAPPVYKIDLPDNLPEELAVPVSNADLQVPKGVSLLSIRPTEFHFKFDEIVSVSLPVLVNKTGNVNDNHVLTSLKADPSTVTVKGPRQQIKAITKVDTETLDLSEITESSSKDVHLKPLPRQIFSDTTSVKVVATVDQAMTTWVVRGVPVRIDSAAIGKIQPDTVSVTLSGPKQVRANFDPKDLSGTVSTIDEGKESDKITPKIFGLPAQLQLKEVDEILVTRAIPTPTPKPTLAAKTALPVGKRIIKQK